MSGYTDKMNAAAGVFELKGKEPAVYVLTEPLIPGVVHKPIADVDYCKVYNEMLAMLEELDTGMDCPFCQLTRSQSHAKDCRLAALLKRTRGES